PRQAATSNASTIPTATTTHPKRRSAKSLDGFQSRCTPISMQMYLRSPVRRVAFAVLSFFLVALYVTFAARAFWAAHLATRPGESDIQKSIRLEPSNSEYPAVLARNQALSVATLNDAISNFKIAVKPNPYQSSYWLALA